MNTRQFLVVGGVLLLAVTLICSSFAAVDSGGPQPIDKAMLEAAQAGLKATQAVFAVGNASIEDVYRWSMRVMEAQHRSPQARKDHAARMLELNKKMKAMAQGGALISTEEMSAVDYFLAEAIVLDRPPAR